jgi:hypothetical protein
MTRREAAAGSLPRLPRTRGAPPDGARPGSAHPRAPRRRHDQCGPRSLLAKLNPFNTRSKSKRRGEGPPPFQVRPAGWKPRAPGSSARRLGDPCYTYLAAEACRATTLKPSCPSRAAAKAQQASRHAQAINEYQLAVKSDSGLFRRFITTSRWPRWTPVK